MGRKGERDRGEIDTDTETDRYGGQKGVEYTHPCSLNRKKVLFSEAVNIFLHRLQSWASQRCLSIRRGFGLYLLMGKWEKRHLYTRV